MGGSPGITELMARLLREVEGGSVVRARFVSERRGDAAVGDRCRRMGPGAQRDGGSAGARRRAG